MAGIALLLLLGGTFVLQGVPAQTIRVRRQNMKVRINATGDTIVMKFVRPSPDVKLEGYILGYGSSMFSKQFIQLPENGQPYETEMDAEPKYLVAVQPIPANDVKKHCTGKVNLEKPLHLVIGSVSPTAVLLSWGNYLKTPYEGNIMNECLEDGFYTIRYRERNRKWIYQTCPTSDTVVDNLKPNTPYEFGVRSNKDDRSGMWSKPIIHNTNMGNKNTQKPYKLRNPLAKPLKPLGPHTLFPPRPALHNRTRLSPLLKTSAFPGAPRTSFAPPESQQETLPPPDSTEPKWPHVSLDEGNAVKNDTDRPVDRLPAFPQLLPTKAPPANTTPLLKLPSNGGLLQGQTTKAPSHAPETPDNPAAFGKSQDGSSLLRSALANERANSNRWGQSSKRNLSPRLPLQPYNPVGRSMRPASRNPLFPLSNGLRQTHSSSRPSNSSPTSGILGVNGQPHRGISPPKPALWSRPQLGSPARPSIPINKKPNLTGKPGETDKVNNFKQTDKLPILKPKVPPATAKPTKLDRKQTTTAAPAVPTTRQETWEDSDLFKSQPASDVDALGKKRYTAPHVVYQTGKKPDEPCSITSSLNYFPEDEPGEANVTAPPKSPPSNLTVVTVEGCPSFVILDWEKTDNDTTEYEVISTTKGPDGEQVSILTTNQTHTAVENLKPESSYEFKVKPKNELGEGPPSEPVSFNTESADPRVSENVSGKDAIWTQFPFKTDSYSDCHGKQYVKRTWYRKFVGIQLCNSLRYKIYLSDSLNGKFYNIGDQTGFGEDHCQFVDSFLDGRTGRQLRADQLPSRPGFYRAVRQEPVHFGQIGGHTHINYVSWYECGTPIPGKW
ncbi:ABI family, member 3 (NESH) binding protein b isoform X1 [Epinephelus fuscoguttatus]|uniref:ABI family, member 3 (NESH) binding protein b isoform X1 n=1 Tax=Epinephelus fuscoguttatus TaxID=293821 RepID=UPI0020D11ECA|nr:ABI family, member 3 (NESH) binding protein b isoform X1 [Epinephelus fuscoguttatus]